MSEVETSTAHAARRSPITSVRLVGLAGLPFNGSMGDEDQQGRGGDGSPDEWLVAVAQRRDREAFTLLFGHFGPRIKMYLMRTGCDPTAAEELVQEVMVTLWRRAETFDPDQARASTWVFTIARNKRIDSLRRGRRPEVDPDDPALVPAPDPAADARVEAAQRSARLRVALDALPDEQREMLRLAYFEDKPHSAIAVEHDLPLGTVKSRIRLALARLRREMGEA